MSTILEALRKSEQERNQNKVPTLNDMTAPTEPSKWPLVLAMAVVLLAIALVVLAYVIWSSGEPASDLASSNNHAQIDQSVESVNVQESGIASTEIKQLTSVNIVSYSENPELRFAMVNGKMIREGEFIQPGLKVDEIRTDSVVFNLRGETLERSP